MIALLVPVVERPLVHRHARRLACMVLLAVAVAVAFALIGPSVLLLLSPGALLIGTEAEQTAAFSPSAKQQGAQQLECTTEGDVDEIHFKANGEQAAGAIWAAIYKENAGAPGAVLGTGKTETKPGNNAWYAIKLTATVKVKAGTTYWVGGVAVAAWKLLGKTGGTSTVRESTKATYTEPTETSEWATVKTKGPLSIYGTGTINSAGTKLNDTGSQASTPVRAGNNPINDRRAQSATKVKSHAIVPRVEDVGSQSATPVKTSIAPEVDIPPEADVVRPINDLAAQSRTPLKSLTTQQTAVRSSQQSATPVRSFTTQRTSVSSVCQSATPVSTGLAQGTGLASAQQSATPVKSGAIRGTVVNDRSSQSAASVHSYAVQGTALKTICQSATPLHSFTTRGTALNDRGAQSATHIIPRAPFTAVNDTRAQSRTVLHTGPPKPVTLTSGSRPRVALTPGSRPVLDLTSGGE